MKRVVLLLLSILMCIAVGATRPLSSAPAAATPPVQVVLYGVSLVWEAPPGTRVVALLKDADGQTKGSDDALADFRGDVRMAFAPSSPGGPPSLIRPGDRIMMAPGATTPPFTVTVPSLAVAPTADGRRLFGRAPPDARITVSLGVGQVNRTNLGAYAADGAGVLDIPLSTALGPDGMGDVIYVDAGDHQFTVPFAMPRGEVIVGTSGVSGRASAGSRVMVTISSSSGAPLGASDGEVAADRRWSKTRGSGTWQPGDQIGATIGGPVPGTDGRIEGTVPRLSIGLSDDRRILSGEAPPDTGIELVVREPRGEAAVHAVQAGPDGRYALDTGGRLPRGTSAEAVLVDPGGLQFSAALSDPTTLEVDPYGQLVRGTIDEPGATVIIRLRSSNGDVKESGSAIALEAASGSRAAGYFYFRFAPTVRIEPGDVLELDWRAGDPWLVPIPRITAIADSQSEAVFGDAPPGARIEVTTQRGALAQDLRMIDAGDDGRFRVDYAGTVDLGAPDNSPALGGKAVVVSSNGVRVVHTWVVADLTLSMQGGLSSHGPPSRDVAVTLRGPDGTERGTYVEQLAAMSSGRRVRWDATMRDSAGFEVSARPGDRFDVVVGDEAMSLIVPELDAVLHVDENRLVGRTSPNTAVWIGLPPGLGTGYFAISDALGIFSHDFGGDIGLVYTDSIWISLTIGDRHKVYVLAKGPAIFLDLDGGIVEGSHEPGVTVAVASYRDGAVMASGTARADSRGAYIAGLAGVDDPERALRKGDAFRVMAPDAQGNQVVELAVPELSIAVDWAARAVHGLAEPGGTLELYASARFRRWSLQEGQSWRSGPASSALINADGTYHVALPSTDDEGPDLRPGQQFTARYNLPSGHAVRRSRTVPIANAHLGGAEVCGVIDAWQQAEAQLMDAGGAVLARGAARADGQGTFSLLLRDASGRPARMAAGQRVSATLGADAVIVPLGAAAVTPRWETPRGGSSNDLVSTLTGHGPPAWDYYVTSPVASCLQPARSGNQLDLEGHTTADGLIRQRTLIASASPSGTLRRPVPAGGAVEVAFFTPGGQRYYLRADRGKIVAFVRTDQVEGHAVPISDLHLALMGAGGTARASANATADEHGTYRARLVGADGRPVRIEPGDRVVLTTPTGDEELLIEPLDFDFSAAAGLYGQAPTGREIEVTLRLADGREVTFDRIADEQGRIAYGVADRPATSDWTFADVVHARVVMRDATGHEIVVESIVGEEPGGPTITRVVFLPRTWR